MGPVAAVLAIAAMLLMFIMMLGFTDARRLQRVILLRT
jgi:hypothetical protein